MSNFSSTMYPETATMSDGALQNAYGILSRRVGNDADHPVFKCGFSKGDFVEALAVIILEQGYRWENGGKERHAAIFAAR